MTIEEACLYALVERKGRPTTVRQVWLWASRRIEIADFIPGLRTHVQNKLAALSSQPSSKVKRVGRAKYRYERLFVGPAPQGGSEYQ